MVSHAATATGYRDLLTQLTDFGCSQHIASVAINAAGTGYVAGELLTIPHASAHLVASIEVLTVDTGGEILTVAIRNRGAYAAQVVSAVVNAGGSGYTDGCILQAEGGTWTNRAKFTATVVAGAVTAVALFEGGGSYTAFPGPTGVATTVVGPSGVSGSGCTIDLTTQALIGTTGISASGGSGSGATFNLTLDDTGITAVRNRNDYSTNGITDEKEVIFEGTVGGTNQPYFGFRTYTQTSGPSTRYGWIIFGMDTFNDGLATAAQINVGPTVDPGSTGVNLLMFNATEDYWFNVNGRRVIVVRKAQGGTLLTYQSAYAGFLLPHGTETESPYPMYLSGSTSVSNRLPDAGSNLVTGLTELRSESATTCPAFFRHPGTGTWTRVQNISNTSSTKVNALYPLGGSTLAAGSVDDGVVADSLHELYDNFVDVSGGGTATLVLYPTLDDQPLLWPCIVKSTPTTGVNDTDTTPRGELDGVYWVSALKNDGSNMAPEDLITDAGGDRHLVFPNAGRSQTYSFFALKED